MAKGIIYVMKTCVDGLIKIGRTGINNFEQRMSELERNGYHRISVLYREFAIAVEDFEDKEELLHRIFEKSRVGDSELFAVNIEDVKQLMSSMAGTVIYPKGLSANQVFEQATEIIESKKGIIPNGVYYLSQKARNGGFSIKAQLFVDNGKLMLKQGSMIGELTGKITDGWLSVRNSLSVENHILKEDVECDSPSMASSIVVGHASNGWDLWKTSSGEKIDMYRKHSQED